MERLLDILGRRYCIHNLARREPGQHKVGLNKQGNAGLKLNKNANLPVHQFDTSDTFSRKTESSRIRRELKGFAVGQCLVARQKRKLSWASLAATDD